MAVNLKLRIEMFNLIKSATFIKKSHAKSDEKRGR